MAMAGFYSSGAAAQTIPGGADAARVPLRSPAAPAPQRETPIALPETGAEALAPPGAAEIRFTLREVVLEGVTAYAPGALDGEWSGLVGTTVSVADVFELARRLTARYRGDGYIISEVTVPKQTIATGRLVLRAVEGYASEVRYEGGELPGTLKEGQTRRLLAARPLTAAVLERALLLFNDAPGITARGILVPPPAGAPAGATILTIIAEHKAIDAFASVDNRGSKAIGPWQGSLGVTENGNLGYGESIGATAVSTPSDELHAGTAETTVLLGEDGLSLRNSFYYGRTRPGASSSIYDIHGRTWTAASTLSYPVLRARPFSLWIDARLAGGGTETQLSELQRYDDQVRRLDLGARIEARDALSGVWTARLDISHGLDGLGASRSGADGRARQPARFDFWKTSGEFGREQPLGAGFSAYTGVTGQWSGAPLPSAEQFGLGGSRFGRAFDPSAILGDSGAAGVGELRYTQGADVAGLTAFQIYVFGDGGRVFLRDAIAGQDSASTLASVGAGIRLWAAAGLSGGVEVSKPLVDDPARPNGSRDPRLFFALRWDW